MAYYPHYGTTYGDSFGFSSRAGTNNDLFWARYTNVSHRTPPARHGARDEFAPPHGGYLDPPRRRQRPVSASVHKSSGTMSSPYPLTSSAALPYYPQQQATSNTPGLSKHFSIRVPDGSQSARQSAQHYRATSNNPHYNSFQPAPRPVATYFRPPTQRPQFIQRTGHIPGYMGVAPKY